VSVIVIVVNVKGTEFVMMIATVTGAEIEIETMIMTMTIVLTLMTKVLDTRKIGDAEGLRMAMMIIMVTNPEEWSLMLTRKGLSHAKPI